MFDSPTGIEQIIPLVGDMDLNTEIIIGCQEVMNWFDGLVIDMLWVGHSKFWAIPKMEDVPYTQTWGQMLKKRLTLTVIWLVGAFIIAGLVMLMPH